MDGIYLVEPQHRALLTDLFVALRGDVVAMQQLYPLTFSDEELEIVLHEKEPDRSYVFIFEGKAVGYGLLRYEHDGYPTLALAVHPEYRNRGLGTILGDELIAAAKEQGAHLIVLFVFSWNPARRLYERLGFCFTKHAGEGESLIGSLTLWVLHMRCSCGSPPMLVWLLFFMKNGF